MKTGLTLRITAILLLVLSCGAFADCHPGCGFDGCDWNDGIFDACRLAAVHLQPVDHSPFCSDYTAYQPVLTPQVCVTDIFRPPNSLA